MNTLMKADGLKSLNSTAPSTAASGFRFDLFLFILLIIPACLYGLAVPMVRAGFGYERWGLSKWGPVLNFPFQAKQLNADVVVFGDSTAFLGMDPRLVNRELGIHSLVLPNTIGSLPVTEDLALERYLEHNKAPRLLVFYFGPWNLDYDHNNQEHLFFEGEEMLLRHGTWREINNFAWRHPAEALAFPFQLNSQITLTSLRESLYGSRSTDVLKTLGHRDFTETVPALTDSCVIPEKYIEQTGLDSVERLVKKYQGMKLQVAVYLAPIPACSNADQVTSRSYGRVGAAGPLRLPGHLFAQDGYYGHLRPEAVPIASHMFAQALRSRPDMASSLSPTVENNGARDDQ